MNENIKVVICNNLGMHARAAAAFVKKASAFKSDVSVRKDDTEIDGKSIMGLIMLGAPKGAEIEIKASGEDAKNCIEALKYLVTNKFGEES